MISPSSSRTRRKTPCADGCSGPKLIVKLRTLCSVIATRSALAIGIRRRTERHQEIRASSLFPRLLVSRQHVVRAFPRGHEIEIAELLLQFDRFIDDALGGIVVTHLDVSCRREVLAQRMPLETVVGENTAKVCMTGEGNTVHVP